MSAWKTPLVAVGLAGLLSTTAIVGPMADAASSHARPARPASSAPSRIVLGSPAYFYPGATWTAAIAGAPSLRYLIANPASGPGAARDPAYAAVVSASRASGVTVLGYVSTQWGRRPLPQVLRDIAAYRAWYGVSGIFLDEASTAASDLPYYRRLAATVRSRPGGTLALNPGTVPDERYAQVADLLVVFEGTYSSYRTWRPPVWQQRYPRQRFWHLVYDVLPDEMPQALRTADRRSAGVVYVTDDQMDNPWDRLPTYWLDALDVVRSLDRSGRRT